jgi:hypothetical protein
VSKRDGAADRVVVHTQKPPGRGGSVHDAVGWLALLLDGEGVFTFLHALFHVFNLLLLLRQQEMFNPIESCVISERRAATSSFVAVVLNPYSE